MDSSSFGSVRAHIEKMQTQAVRGFERRLLQIYGIGDLSGITSSIKVRDAVRAAEENAEKLVADVVPQGLPAPKTPEVFRLIESAIDSHLSSLEALIERGNGIPLSSSMLEVATDRFDAVRERVIRKLGAHRPGFEASRNKGGRPPTRDWEGALIHLISIANTPDGLPTGSAAQARIEEMISQWFSDTTGDVPAESEVRIRAAKVITALSRTSRAGN